MLQISIRDLYFCWDSIKIILQHNAIKASFQKSLQLVDYVFNVTMCKILLGFLSKYVFITYWEREWSS